MGNFNKIIFIMSIILVLFYFGGIIEGGSSANSILVNFILNPENIQNISLMGIIVGAMSGIGIFGAIYVGIRTSNAELVANASVTIFLLNVMWDFIIVFTEIKAENPFLAIFIFGSLFLAITITAYDFFRGRD